MYQKMKHQHNLFCNYQIETLLKKRLKTEKYPKVLYCLRSLYVTSKTLQINLYDDGLGTSLITVITKYCNSCKFTYYPGYFENYQDKCTYFYPEWRNYGVFISTYCSAFSTDLLDRLICMKQKCHTTFLGKTQAYNMQHEYQKAEKAKAMDKRRLADAYYKYTFILYKGKYNLPMEIKGSMM